MDITSYKKKIFKIKTDDEFNVFALNLFEYQYHHNPIYRKYVDLNHIPIGSINKYQDIPFLPIELFRNNKIITANKASETTFISSGTTSLEKSKHHIGDLEIYRKSLLNCFHFFFGDPGNYVFFCLIPEFEKNPHSSLSFMCSQLIEASNSSKSGFYIKNTQELIIHIKQCQKEKKKFILFGLSFEILDFSEKNNILLNGGIVIETGGNKRKQEHIPQEELHKRLKYRFGLDTICSEYGMAELLSQSYYKNDFFQSPPWKKILIRDKTQPFKIIAPNKRGCINIIDLANIYSCGFIASNDLGYITDNGFKIIGRAQNATQKGCSLMT